MSEVIKVGSTEIPLANRGRFAGPFLRSLPLPGKGPGRRVAIVEALVVLMGTLALDQHSAEIAALAHMRNPDAHANDAVAEVHAALFGEGGTQGACAIVAAGGRGSEASIAALEAVIVGVLGA